MLVTPNVMQIRASVSDEGVSEGVSRTTLNHSEDTVNIYIKFLGQSGGYLLRYPALDKPIGHLNKRYKYNTCTQEQLSVSI